MLRFGDRSDLLEFCDSTSVANVWLQDVNSLRFHKFIERILQVEALARGDGDSDVISDLSHLRHVLLRHRLLEPEWAILLEALAQFNSSVDVELSVDFDQDVDVRPNSFSHRRNPIFRQLSFFSGYRVIAVVTIRIEFQGGVAHCHDPFGLFGIQFWGAGSGVPAVCVHPDFVANRAAQKLVNRNT